MSGSIKIKQAGIINIISSKRQLETSGFEDDMK
jgi:hypothetical protein